MKMHVYNFRAGHFVRSPLNLASRLKGDDIVWLTLCADCVSAELCVYAELRSVWAARCDDLYHFNLLQKTNTQCQSVELHSLSHFVIIVCPMHCIAALDRQSLAVFDIRSPVSVLRPECEKHYFKWP